MSEQKYEPGHHPSLPPPGNLIGPIAWAHKHLFSGPYNTILTIIAMYGIWVVIPPFLNWVIFDADFVGSDPEACTGEGACWVWKSVV